MHGVHAWLPVMQQVQVPEAVDDSAACVRLGDVYALVVGTYARQQDWEAALRMLRDMQSRAVSDNGRIPQQVLHAVYRHNGLSGTGTEQDGHDGTRRPGSDGRGGFGDGLSGDEIEEEEEVLSEEEEDGERVFGGVGRDEFGGDHGVRRGGARPGSYSFYEGASGVDGGMQGYHQGVSEEDMYF